MKTDYFDSIQFSSIHCSSYISKFYPTYFVMDVRLYPYNKVTSISKQVKTELTNLGDELRLGCYYSIEIDGRTYHISSSLGYVTKYTTPKRYFFGLFWKKQLHPTYIELLNLYETYLDCVENKLESDAFPDYMVKKAPEDSNISKVYKELCKERKILMKRVLC